jgi:sec-independent protein translocase protein TatA
MPDVGVPELLIILVIVLLLFGPGKAADLGSSLGKSIREFRKATHEDDDAPSPSTIALASASNGTSSAASPSALPTLGRFCTECGSQNGSGAKFCSNCGTSFASMT